MFIRKIFLIINFGKYIYRKNGLFGGSPLYPAGGEKGALDYVYQKNIFNYKFWEKLLFGGSPLYPAGGEKGAFIRKNIFNYKFWKIPSWVFYSKNDCFFKKEVNTA